MITTRKITAKDLKRDAEVTDVTVTATLECGLRGSCMSDDDASGEGPDEASALKALKKIVEELEWVQLQDGSECYYACPDCAKTYMEEQAHGWERVEMGVEEHIRRKNHYSSEIEEPNDKITLLGKRVGDKIYALAPCVLFVGQMPTDAYAMGVFQVNKKGKKETLTCADKWISTKGDVCERLFKNGLRNSSKFLREAVEAHRKVTW